MLRRELFRTIAGAAALGGIGGLTFGGVRSAQAATASEINQKVELALSMLYGSNPVAKALGEKAAGVLIFPDVVKGGLIIGGQFGEGALKEGGRTVGYYNSVAASWGLQAGVQSFGYAMFFMNRGALAYLDKSEGFEIGVGPSIVVMDQGKAANFTSSTVQDDIYAFIFDQKGLMAGIGIEGSKITKITPS